MTKLSPEEFVEGVLVRIGFEDPLIEVAEDRRRAAVTLDGLEEDDLHEVIQALNALVVRHAERHREEQAPFFDVNGYRLERESLIASLARAAAERVLADPSPVSLLPMNSYERRIVHEAVSAIEGVRSESTGLGRGRHVVVFAEGAEPDAL